MKYQLNPGFTLDPHQKIAYDFIMGRPRGGTALWMEPGLGKGFVAPVAMIDWLNAGLKRALIVVPAKLVEDWREKLRQYASIEASVWDDLDRANPIQLISHTMLQARLKRLPELIKWRPEIIIVDEHHRFKSYGAAQTKGLLKLSSTTKPAKRLGMTGTPITTVNPEEMRPQLLFVDPMLLQKMGYDDYNRWRRAFCKIDTVAYGDKVVETVTGLKNETELAKVLAGCALKMTTEVLDLPEQVFSRTYYRMSVKAAAIYRALADDGSYLRGGLEVVTNTPMDRAMKCMQARSGFVYDFDRKVHILDTNLVDTVAELVSTLPLPLLIYYHSRPVGEALEAAFADKRVGRICGDTNAAQAKDIERRFQDGQLDIVIGQEDSISLGYTFTRGHHAVFVEPVVKLDNWIQLLGRTRRRGQKQTCVYHLLIEPSTFDAAAFDCNLAGKQSFAEQITRGARLHANA